jgi:hypothetical protein
MLLRERVDAGIVVTVRYHLIKTTEMIRRVRETTHPDYSRVSRLDGEFSFPDNVLRLGEPQTIDNFTCDMDLEAFETLLCAPAADIGPYRSAWCSTVEVRFTAFELRETVNRFGASAVISTILCMDMLFESVFAACAAGMMDAEFHGVSAIPLVIRSYCADKSALRDPMASIGVDFNIPDVGLIANGDRQGQLSHIRCSDLTPQCWQLEELLRSKLFDMLVEYATQ